MRRVVSILAIIAVGAAVVVALCAVGDGRATGDRATPTATTATSTTTTTTTTVAPATIDPAVAAAVPAAVHTVVPGTRLGFALHDRETGQSLASGDTATFHTASVVKLLIALDALRANGWQPPDDTLGADLTRMLAASDDGVAIRLWAAGGRSAIVTRMAGELGLPGIRPPSTTTMWELTRVTTADVVAIYAFVLDTLPAPTREFLLGALGAAPARAADSFYQHFGIPDAFPGQVWAVKQGWMTTERGLVLNTTGVVGADRRYIVVLLTEQPHDTDTDTARQAVTAGVAALAPALPT